MDGILRIEHVFQYNELIGTPTLHPLAGVAELAPECPIVRMPRVLGFYTLSLREEPHRRCRCGPRDESLLCRAPGQLLMPAKSASRTRVLLFHPDLLRDTPLERTIAAYPFLWGESCAQPLSDAESRVVAGCLRHIRCELEHAVDRHSRTLLVNHIEMLLNYCSRFYGC